MSSGKEPSRVPGSRIKVIESSPAARYAPPSDLERTRRPRDLDIEGERPIKIVHGECDVVTPSATGSGH